MICIERASKVRSHDKQDFNANGVKDIIMKAFEFLKYRSKFLA